MAQTTVSGKPKKVYQQNDNLINFCDWVIKICLYGVAALLPLFFLPYTLNALEFTKQNLLIIFTLIALVAWLGKTISKGVFEFKKNIINIPILVFLVIYGFSSFFSLNRYQSFIGADLQEGFSFLAVLCFVLLYFIVVNNLDSIKKIKSLLMASLIAAFLIGFHGLLQIFGKFILPSAVAQTKAFNLIGTTNSLGIFAALILTVAVAYLISLYAGKHKAAESVKQIILTVFLWALMVLMFLLVILIDYWVIWTVLIVGMVLLLAFGFSRAQDINPKWLMLPMIILVVSVLFQFINLPLNLNLPAEVSPSYKASWEISKGALQEKPILGSGPGTFIFDYSKYKPETINNTIFWNYRFDRALSSVMTLLATIGVLGLVSWLILFIGFIYLIITRFIRARSDENWLLGIGLFSAWLVMFVAKFLYSSNLTFELFTWLLLAILAVFVLNNAESRKISFEASPKTGLLLSFAFIIVVTFSASGLYLVGQRYAAEAYYLKGLRAAQQIDDFGEINNSLAKAIRLNKYRDMFYRSISSLYLAEIERKAGQLSGTEEETEIAALTRDIQILTDYSVNSAKQAVQICQNNVSNWATLAGIYQKISSYVSGAVDWGIESNSKAIELEPTSPVHYTNLAKGYLFKYDLAKAMEQAEGADKQALAVEQQDSLQQATENLTKAIQVKNNYAAAHYQMALVHVRKNDLENAINELAVNYAINPEDVGTLFQLGLLYYQNEEKENAQAALERAVELSPNYSNARWYLASLYEEQGEVAKAIEQIEKVEELNPDNELVKEKLQALRTGKSKPAPPLPEPVESDSGPSVSTSSDSNQ